MPRTVKSEKLRKRNFSITVPQYLIHVLDEMPNKSEVVTQILEENVERIMAGNINKSIEYNKIKIKSEVVEALDSVKEEFMEEIRKKVGNDKEFSGSVDSISESIDKALEAIVDKNLKELTDM